MKWFFFRGTEPQVEGFSFVNVYYRPLLDLLYRLQYKLFRLNPHGYHFFNILAHILSGWMVYVLTRLIARSFWSEEKRLFALTAGTLFLVHPVQSEAVACISGISNLLFTLFCLSSFVLYIQASGGGGFGRYAGALIFFLAALFTKEHSSVLPLVILWWEICRPKKDGEDKKMIAARVAGVWALLAAYFVMRRLVVGYALTTIVADDKTEFWLRLLSVPRGLLTHLRVIFFPSGLHYYRSIDMLAPWAGPAVALLGIAAVFIFVLTKVPALTRRFCLFGTGWFLLGLSPVINIIPMVNEYSLLLNSEHFLYFPLIGMIFCAVGMAGHVLARPKTGLRRAYASAAFILLVVILSIITVRQNRIWRAEVPLFERTLAYEKNFGRVHLLMAGAYYREGQYAKALQESLTAQRIFRDYIEKVRDERVRGFYRGFLKDGYINQAYALEALGRYHEAIKVYQQALAIDSQNAGLCVRLAVNALRVKDIRLAIEAFHRAEVIAPGDLMTLNSLAICYKETGDRAQVEKYLRMIVEKDPGSASAKRNLEIFLRGE